jgi:hypothetical protein
MSGPRSFSSVSQAESTVQVTLGILEPPLHTSWCHLWGALGGCDVEPSLEAYCRACWRPNTATDTDPRVGTRVGTHGIQVLPTGHLVPTSDCCTPTSQVRKWRHGVAHPVGTRAGDVTVKKGLGPQ